MVSNKAKNIKKTYADEVADGIRYAHASFIEAMFERMDSCDMKQGDVSRLTGDAPTMAARAFNPNENITLKTMVRNAIALNCDLRVVLVPKESSSAE